MYKTGVIGDRESVIGFTAVGFKAVEANDAAEAKKALRQMADDNYAVIFITENTACDIGDEIEKYRSKPLPAIILIPGKSGSMGLGLADIKKSVERAVGADILK